MQYKSFTLDPFQEQAIAALDAHKTVIVSAPTGSGKTLIADYLVGRDIKVGKRIIYTSPIKALSNQKFKEFTREYGKQAVGLMTGDVVINPGAMVVIMTTEIYRNMLLAHDPFVEDISYVIFDEVHYINDIERGYVWEEAIIFSPRDIRFLCLSATIPNARQLANWMGTIKGHETQVIFHGVRVVPLAHYFYDTVLGMTTMAELEENVQLDKYPDYEQMHPQRGRMPKKKLPRAPNFLDLIEEVREKQWLPVLYFVFSRANSQKLAKTLAAKGDLLTPADRSRVLGIMQEHFAKQDSQIRLLDSTRMLKELLPKGIGVHHAGLLPELKELVEQLFEAGLIKVLFATETFAVGINMPARSVIFHSLEKYDGISFRYLNSKEYFQLAGRAGRRGIDKEGYVISLVDRRSFDVAKVKSFTGEDRMPITSQFKLGFNTILNMERSHSLDEIEVILRSNFDNYQKFGSKIMNAPFSTMRRSYDRKRKILEKLGYIKEKGLTYKGQFACGIYSNELVISNIFFGMDTTKLTQAQIILLLVVISYESRPDQKFPRCGKENYHKKLLRFLEEDEYVRKSIDPKVVYRLAKFVWDFVNDKPFVQVLQETNLLEGDVIRLFRQAIDVLQQVIRATTDPDLKEKLEGCITIVDREFVQVGIDKGAI
ncbi:MAG: DEAD/DEAH box helicase [Nanoarchaeota archaeon]